MIKKILRPFLNFFRRLFDFFSWDQWRVHSWAQEGEDRVLRRIFENQTNGFYIDVGAHHPKRFSNTYLFYKMGWSGINIDAMPGSMKLFKKYRPRDINIEMGIANQATFLNYYVFNEPALNGFSCQLSEERNSEHNNYNITEVLKLKVVPLAEIFKKHLDGRNIDFLTVDVEGFDLDVLRSNDWSKYRPRFVLAEILKSSLHDVQEDEVAVFMKEQNYCIYAKNVNTVFFQDSIFLS